MAAIFPLAAIVEMDAVVGGHDEAAFVFSGLDLDPGTGAGGIPAPVFFLGHGGDVPWFTPSEAVVIGVHDFDFAGSFCAEDVVFADFRGAVEKEDAPGFEINERGGVSGLVAAVVTDDFDLTPGLSVVSRAAEKDVYIAMVRAAVAAFGEGEQGAFFRDSEGGDPVGVVAVITRSEEDFAARFWWGD